MVSAGGGILLCVSIAVTKAALYSQHTYPFIFPLHSTTPSDRCFDIGLRCKARPPPPPSPPTPPPPPPPSPEGIGAAKRRRSRRRRHFSSNRRSGSSTLAGARTRAEEDKDDGEGGWQEEDVDQTPFQELVFSRNEPMKQVPFFLAAFHRLHSEGRIDRDRVLLRLRVWHTW